MSTHSAMARSAAGLSTQIGEDWRNHAACRDEDPELFFPVGTSGPALLQVEQAKAVCRRCLVTDECLAWALDSGADEGVWGGASSEERRSLERRGVRPAAAKPEPQPTTGTIVDRWAAQRDKDPDLGVGEMAKVLGVPRQALSQALNRARKARDHRVLAADAARKSVAA